MTAALILPPTEDSFRRVAGLPLLQRSALAALRAGFAPVRVLATTQRAGVEALVRGDARLRRLELVTELSQIGEGCVAVLPSDCVVAASTLDRVRSVPADDCAVLFDGTGGAAILVCDAARLQSTTPGDAVAVLRLLEGVARTAQHISLDGTPCLRVTSSADVARAEQALGARLRAESAASDGPLAHWIDRCLSLRISRWLVAHTQLRPNQITVIGTAVGLMAAAFLATGTYASGVVGALLFWCAVVIDGCDGEVARLTFQDSAFGQKFDVITDNIVHAAIFLGLGVGMYRRDPDGQAVLLLALLLGGFALNLVVTYFFLVRRPDFARDDRAPGTWRGRMRQRLLRLFEAAMNRDFAYLIVLLALINRLDWFLWGTAIGTYAFALLLVLVYRWGNNGEHLGC